jgi:hypothetical protein
MTKRVDDGAEFGEKRRLDRARLFRTVASSAFITGISPFSQ